VTAWTGFYPFVLPYVPGCPDPMVEGALRNAAREFCSQSRIWREESAPVVSDGTTRERSFVFLSADAELVKVEEVWVNGEEWGVVHQGDMPPDWLEATPETTFEDKIIVLDDLTGYVLHRIPASGENIQLFLSVQPKIAAASVGDVVYNRYAEALGHGAVSRLCRMVGPKDDPFPWESMKQAEISEVLFRQGITDAGNQRLSQVPPRTGGSFGKRQTLR
jgi:hypothetical protein